MNACAIVESLLVFGLLVYWFIGLEINPLFISL
jgi:hypothetical protein